MSHWIRHPQAWLALASLATVLWLFALQVDHVSPGPISATHGREEDLLGRGSCAHCHGRGEDAMAQACGECHAEVEQGIAQKSGFHGTLAAGIDPRDCGACHFEHSGPAFPLVNEKSFRVAGFDGRADYDHAALDFELAGRHARLTCAECHANADAVLLPAEEPRFLGLDQGCQSCHEDAHEGRIALACGDCHGQEHPFALVASFEHAGVTCATCHEVGTAHEVELLAGPAADLRERGCAACHESPHDEDFLTSVALLTSTRPAATCTQCHAETHASFAGHPEALPPALHAASGFALDRPHNALACQDCHAAELDGDTLTAFALARPARTQDACEACHGDPHAGQFEAGV